jgi:superoxide dismutase, Fe-Mn family
LHIRFSLKPFPTNQPAFFMQRRTFLTHTTASSLALAPILTTAAAQPAGALELPALAYAPEALEPHIDAMTMRLHHDKHHAAYLTKLKEALDAAQLPSGDLLTLLADLSQVPEAQRSAVRNHGGGHVNHTWFWSWMTPAGSGPSQPGDALGSALQETFGSLADFQKAFSTAGMKRFGSGWAWLILNAQGKLQITSTPNQDNPLMRGSVPDTELGTPLLGVDLWEHAYYLKYQNKRDNYLSAWWNVVNWAEVEHRYTEAKR